MTDISKRLEQLSAEEVKSRAVLARLEFSRTGQLILPGESYSGRKISADRLDPQALKSSLQDSLNNYERQLVDLVKSPAGAHYLDALDDLVAAYRQYVPGVQDLPLPPDAEGTGYADRLDSVKRTSHLARLESLGLLRQEKLNQTPEPERALEPYR